MIAPDRSSLRDQHSPVPQNGITLLWRLRAGQEAPLLAALDEIGSVVKATGRPFGNSDRIHYARFVFIPRDIDPRGRRVDEALMYLADFDGSPAEHLHELARLAGPELLRLGSFCAAPCPMHDGERTEWLKAHVVPNATYYVNTRGRTVQQIRREAVLRQRIEEFLDARKAGGGLDEVRRDIQGFVRKEPALAWALEPPPSELPRQIRKVLALAAAAIAALACLAVLWPLLLLWAVVLRCHEDIDPEDPTIPSSDHIEELARVEDLTLQNQFSALGFLKVGLFRLLTARIVLAIGNFATRYLFDRESLAGVTTIHFARWTFLDGRRRMLFASNYDGSLENYMSDFIDIVAWGLNGIFSNGVGYPRTRWLLLDGARNEIAFKRHIRNRQIPTQVWYSAYPNLSAINIARNARVRLGLAGSKSAEETRAWLALL